jgi:hypothetical protein
MLVGHAIGMGGNAAYHPEPIFTLVCIDIKDAEFDLDQVACTAPATQAHDIGYQACRAVKYIVDLNHLIVDEVTGRQHCFHFSDEPRRALENGLGADREAAPV